MQNANQAGPYQTGPDATGPNQTGPQTGAGQPRNGFEQDLRNAAARAEDELQRLLRYINDEVVPDVRKHSSVALRSASDGLRSLADRMERGGR